MGNDNRNDNRNGNRNVNVNGNVNGNVHGNVNVNVNGNEFAVPRNTLTRQREDRFVVQFKLAGLTRVMRELQS